MPSSYIPFASPPPIGNSTPNTGAFTTETAVSGTLTASADYTVAPGTTVALNRTLLFQTNAMLLESKFLPGISQGADDSGGGGASANNMGAVRLNTSVTNGGRGSWYFNPYDQFALPGTGIQASFSFNTPMSVHWKFAFTVALTTNAVFRQTVGNSGGNGGATTVLSKTGFGFGVVYKTATTGSVVAYTYDSSLHTSAEIAVIDTSNAGVMHEVVAVSNGAGSISYFVDGSTTANLTVATGPTGTSTGYLNNDVVLNGVDAVNNIVYFYQIDVNLKKS